jgi:hypothetical protein
MERVDMRIRYRGRSDLARLGVQLPSPELIRTTYGPWSVGEELVPIRGGWFVHESTIEDGVVTLTVERRPPE